MLLVHASAKIGPGPAQFYGRHGQFASKHQAVKLFKLLFQVCDRGFHVPANVLKLPHLCKYLERLSGGTITISTSGSSYTLTIGSSSSSVKAR